MGILNQNVYPRPASWEEFEQMVADAYSCKYPDMEVGIYGRQGQTQKGIDILLYNNTSQIGIQCKNHTKFTTSNIDEIIDAVKLPIQKLIIAVSVQRDKNLLDYVREKSKASLIIQIVFWEDIINELATNKLLPKYYPQFFGDDFRIAKDKSLFFEFLDDFVKSGIKSYFSNLVAVSRFDNEIMSLFFTAIEKWSDINYMFHFPEIEICRLSFIENASSLAYEISKNTWDDDRDFDHNAIPREWITRQPDRYNNVVKTIDEKLALFRYSLDVMILMGKRNNLL